MSFVNLGESDLLVEFAALLKEFDDGKGEEYEKLAESKTGGLDLIEKGFVKIYPKILETGKKLTIETSAVMAIAVAARIEDETEKAVTALKDLFLENQEKIEPLTLLSLLTSLFNLIDERSKLRYEIFMALGARAKNADAANWMVGQDILDSLDLLKEDWNLTSNQFSEMLLMLLKLCHSTHKKEEFGELLLKYLASLDEEEKKISLDKEVQDWTVDSVCETLKAPFEMANRMRTLSNLRCVKELSATEHAPLVEMLDSYVNEDFKKYLAFADKKENLDYMVSRNITHDENINHFRVFAACKLPLGEYSYEVMHKALEVPEKDDIEAAVIRLVLTKKVDARIDQARNCIHIRHTAQREFRDAQWSELGTQLRKWKEGVKNVLTTLYKARQEI
eukprot:CAMPEP_0184495012 /NCGR_PEP_ID=MMETSP0113_2-20130426/30147_1 /TAXON_ID=91329 /ORGANISM="Norrisiella sphaerica, Strain BC52" /LENGTH=391 /DNA_ID=CAMNT_0026881009 /DNA_START=47 /DNA_END=1222 /DNA_ORIENTATION=+